MKITVKQAIDLQKELFFFLGEKMTVGYKYKLTKFFNTLTPLVELAKAKYDEVLLKYSNKARGIPEELPNGDINPDIKKFNEEIKPIMDEEVEMDFPVINISENKQLFDSISENYYPTMIKLQIICID